MGDLGVPYVPVRAGMGILSFKGKQTDCACVLRYLDLRVSDAIRYLGIRNPFSYDLPVYTSYPYAMIEKHAVELNNGTVDL